MTIRVCDRCGATANAIALQATRRTIIVPQASPSTAAVGADVEISVAVDAGDLCDACLASALLEFAFAKIPPDALTPAAIKALIARITTRLRDLVAG